jgi:predicted RND superfamily exporter protein
MKAFSSIILKHKKAVAVTFILLAVVSLLMMGLVRVNYKLDDYLPKDAQSTLALKVMEKEFGSDLPNARVMLKDVSIQQALDCKKQLEEIDGILAVSWLDDVVGEDILRTTPVAYLDSKITEAYYKERNALIYIAVESGSEESTIRAVYDLIGENNSVAGNAVGTATSQELSASETAKAIAILVPVILFILLISTASWLEPILYLLTIGIAVLINMGTNIFFGEVSFVTKSVSPILQLAVSLDYAIFLLHSFNDYRREHEPKEAMRLAMKAALSSVAASAATTVVGFLALSFMRFSIGFDLGINLVKGVVLSFISVMVFLPAITLMSYKLIDRFKHKKLFPSFKKAGSFLLKIRIPLLILALIVVIPCYLANSQVGYRYGMDIFEAKSRAGRDSSSIEAVFGSENQLVLLVPKGEAGKEAELCSELEGIDNIKAVVSYVSSVGSEIPAEYIPEDTLGQFYSDNYARIILYTNMENEGEEAFATVGQILDTAAAYYDDYYLAGQSAALYDMHNTVSVDTRVVNIIAIIGILLVLLLTFKSLSLPVILLFTIETAIFINLSFAYFSGQAFNFIGYLVISTVQLGATVDYAILLTDRYQGLRKEYNKKEAMNRALVGNIPAILVSAAILSLSGFTLSATSTNQIIAELGTLLFRGTLLSFLMVVGVLPALLILLDKLITKTTLNREKNR